jgi:hypothetical protein
MSIAVDVAPDQLLAAGLWPGTEHAQRLLHPRDTKIEEQERSTDLRCQILVGVSLAVLV